MIRSLVAGNRLEISLLSDKKATHAYVSQVEEVMDASHVKVHMPISYGELMRLDKNVDYSALFFTDRGMLRFDCQVVEYSKDGDFHFLILEMRSEGERIQRRDFFRYEVMLPLKFALLDEESLHKLDSIHIEYEDGVVQDIGGGGIRFVSNVLLEEDDLIRIVLLLNNETIVVLGRILHRQYFPKSNYKYQYRVIFVGEFLAEQTKIVQYIFNEQRKEIKRLRRQ